MKVTKVCCQGCGSPLGIDEDTRYVTCNHCGSSLEVIHGEAATHTRLLEKIEGATRELSHQVKLLKLQADLERLDREWERFRDSVLPRTAYGQIIEPSSARDWSAFGLLLIVVGGVVGLTALVSGAVGIGLFGVGGILAGAACKMKDNTAINEYHRLKEAYHSSREKLLHAIDGERRVA